jgi:hypothetical protein
MPCLNKFISSRRSSSSSSKRRTKKQKQKLNNKDKRRELINPPISLPPPLSCPLDQHSSLHYVLTTFVVRSVSAALKLIQTRPVTLAIAESLETRTTLHIAHNQWKRDKNNAKKEEREREKERVYGLVPSSTEISGVSTGGSFATAVAVAVAVVVEASFACCCSRSLEMTVPLNLSSCLLGSQRSVWIDVAGGMTGLGVERDSTLGVCSAGCGSGVSPSFCFTYD